MNFLREFICLLFLFGTSVCGSIGDKPITEIRRRITADEIPPRVNISALVLAEESGVRRTPVKQQTKPKTRSRSAVE